ncbi:MAG: hypothetical protein NZZ41_03760 [Candidatus Dojkabacteria bacterium]|nr:hypothetical protein [Candidatus Dojkabacteria bacterium]
MYILGIDTSCDETSAAVIENSCILSNVVSSQANFHRAYGGVVPSIAKLNHQLKIDKVVNMALKRAGIQFNDLEYIAVTIGPGLAIALEVGINFAKKISTEFKIPIIPINHMEGHLWSFFLQPHKRDFDRWSNNNSISYPSLGVLISGGHSEFILVEGFRKYTKIGETLDDACGECLDKCARTIGLGYPGGIVLAKLANIYRHRFIINVINNIQLKYVQITSKYDSNISFMLPIPKSTSLDFNLSFSGLKTAFNNLVSSIKKLDKEIIFALCVLLEATAMYSILVKIEKIIEKYKDIKELWLGGGVVANNLLNKLLRRFAKQQNLVIRKPYSKKLTGDNAAMIALIAYLNFIHNIRYSYNIDKIDRIPSLDITETSLLY